MTPIEVMPLERELLAGVPGLGEHRASVDLAVIPVWEDERPLRGLGGLLDWRVGGRLSRLVRTRFCGGSDGEAVLLPGDRRLPARRLVLVGLGSARAFGETEARRAGEHMVAVAANLRPQDVLLALPTTEIDRSAVEAMLDGVTHGLAGVAGKDAGTWWVVAEPAHAGRLRALLEGPPRAAEEA